MPNPIYDGFHALIDLTEDQVLKRRLEKRVEALFADKKDESALVDAYLAIEKELIASNEGHLNEREIRKRVKRAFEGVEEEYPSFPILFMSDEKQYVHLINELIVEYAHEWHIFFGNQAVKRALLKSLNNSPWDSLEISVEKGVVFDPVRMRSVKEVGEIALTLFGDWYQSGNLMFGKEASKRTFERAYRNSISRHAHLPVYPKLLGAMPLDVLSDEKAARIRELETRTSSQAMDIRTAGVDLKRQAEKLVATGTELSETKEKLLQTSRARSEFIAVVSHQFRTPLSSIRWNSELLTDAVTEGKIDNEFGEAIDMIRTKSIYLIDTLDRVFTTLDIDTEEIHLDLEKGFLWEIVQNVYQKYEKDIERLGLKWTFKRRKAQVQEVLMDKDRIAMALRILVSNAILYNKEGGAIEIDIDTVERNGKKYQMCSIRDEGIGISKEDQAKIFQKFYRSKPSILKIADGTGLGMYVVKHIIENHKGEVLLESEGKDKGTKISFTLPLASEA